MRKRKNKNGHKLRNKLKNVLIVMAVIGLVLYGSSIYIRQSKEMDRLKAEAEELRLSYESELYRAKRLNELQALVGTDQYIERVARDSLGLIRPDEIIFLHKD